MNSKIKTDRIQGTLFFLVLIVSFSVAIFAQDTQRPSKQASLEDLLNTRVSTASKYEQQMNDAPASITIVTGEDIERYGYQTLQEVLINVSGFYTSYDRDYGYVGVRGFGRPTDYNNRVLLLVNGYTLNEGIFGSALIETSFGIDMADVDRIEIVRGPGSSLYGTWAMLAVINVITKTGAKYEQGRVSGEIGSYGRLKGSTAYGGASGNGLDFFVSGRWGDIKGQNLYFKEYDSPETNHGLATGLDWDKFHSFFASATYKNFFFQGYLSSRTKGVPTGSWGTDFNDPDSLSYDSQRFVEIKYSHEFSSRLNLSLRGNYSQYLYHADYPYDNITFSESADGRTLGSELKFLCDLSSRNRLIFGFEYRDYLRAFYRYGEPGRDDFSGDFPYRIFSFYAQDEFHLRRDLTLTLGLRHDHYSTVGSSTDPRLALVYRPFNGTALKLLYGDAFRAPNLYETNYADEYVDSIEPGTIYQKVNPHLRSEKIRTLEFAFEQRLTEGLYGRVSLYSFRMKDLIDLVLDPMDGWYMYSNVSRVMAAGIEFELKGRSKSGSQAYASYSYQNARDQSSDVALTNCPNHLFKSGVSFPLFKSISLGTQFLYESGRMTVYGTRTKGFFLTNLNLRSDLLFRHVRLSVRVENLFDTRYAYPGGYEHLEAAITQNGRNYIVRLEFIF